VDVFFKGHAGRVLFPAFPGVALPAEPSIADPAPDDDRVYAQTDSGEVKRLLPKLWDKRLIWTGGGQGGWPHCLFLFGLEDLDGPPRRDVTGIR
jgi:hypothetical protein